MDCLHRKTHRTLCEGLRGTSNPESRHPPARFPVELPVLTPLLQIDHRLLSFLDQLRPHMPLLPEQTSQQQMDRLDFLPDESYEQVSDTY